MGKARAEGKTPYRAFVYTKFCNGKLLSDCGWAEGKTMKFSFSIKSENMKNNGNYVKTLFWTDNGNILGFVPSQHPNGDGKYRLITFPDGDYPHKWEKEMEIEDNSWYRIGVQFTPGANSVEVAVNGIPMGSGKVPKNMLEEKENGPQLEVYSFNYGSKGTSDSIKFHLKDVCVGETTGSCER